MNIIDLINSGFCFLGTPFILVSVFKLYRQKQVKGISWVHAGFFTAWSLWNLFYFPSMGQWISFAGGILLAIINSIWMGQLIYYSRTPKDPQWSYKLSRKIAKEFPPPPKSKEVSLKPYVAVGTELDIEVVDCMNCKFCLLQTCKNNKCLWFNKTTPHSFGCSYGESRIEPYGGRYGKGLNNKQKDIK